MLKYDEFKDFIMRNARRYIPNKYNLNIQPIKQDRIQYNPEGLYFRESSRSKDTGLVLFIDQLYDMYKNKNNDIEYVLRYISDRVIDSIANRFTSSTLKEQLLTINKIRFNTVTVLISQEGNDDLLKDILYVPFMKYAIVFRYIYERFNNSFSGILLSNETAKHLNIDKDELLNWAMLNTRRILPTRFVSLATLASNTQNIQLSNQQSDLDIINQQSDSDMINFQSDLDMISSQPDLDVISSQPDLDMISPQPDLDMISPIFVLSNEIDLEGASYILYKDILDRIRSDLNTDIFILPVSIDHVLVAGADCFSAKEMREMAHYVNRHVVQPDERLGGIDDVLYYDGALRPVDWEEKHTK